MIQTFQELRDMAKKRGPKTIAVACAEDADVLLAVEAARIAGIAQAILVGQKEELEKVAKEQNIDLGHYKCVYKEDKVQSSLEAVRLVSSGQAHMVMKGLVDTSIILKAVLNKEVGLRAGTVLSHVAVFDIPSYHKILMVTDAAMNIAPDIETKKQIVENALVVSKALDIEMPKVGVICAKEKVNEKMPATLEAQKLVEMNESGNLAGCLVGGPFALDNAVSKEAARIKGINHPAAGDCDILLMPQIEAGNVLYKALNFLCQAQSAGIIVGAKAPVILTSRADSDEDKLNSIALGVLMAAKA